MERIQYIEINKVPQFECELLESQFYNILEQIIFQDKKEGGTNEKINI